MEKHVKTFNEFINEYVVRREETSLKDFYNQLLGMYETIGDKEIEFNPVDTDDNDPDAGEITIPLTPNGDEMVTELLVGTSNIYSLDLPTQLTKYLEVGTYDDIEDLDDGYSRILQEDDYTYDQVIMVLDGLLKNLPNAVIRKISEV